jgi:tetratricopeptide (TPR) repeat protein
MTESEKPLDEPGTPLDGAPVGPAAPEGLTAETGVAAPSPQVEALLNDVFQQAEEGDWEAVAEVLRRSLQDHPGDPYILSWLGMAEREMGLEGVAAERFREALAQEPRDPVLLATAGNALAAFDDPAAEAALRTAALIAPDLPQVRWMYGAWLAREGMIDDALAEFLAAAELDPEDGLIRTEWGVALALGGRLEEAVAAFAMAVELDPEDSWTQVLLGLAHLESGDEESAARELEGAARLRPDDLDAQLLASLALGAEGEEDRAFEMLERARLTADEAGEEVDLHLVVEVEEQLEGGAASALRFLRQTLGPSSFRERLMQRP